MADKIISEDQVKKILDQVLSEQTSKVKRDEFARVLFKIDELQNSLNDTVREFRKLEDSIPTNLKPLTNSRIKNLSSYFVSSQRLLLQLKEKIKSYKRNSYSQQVDEKKKIG